MKSKSLRSLRGSEGKGILGCLVFVVLLGVAVFLAIRLGPIYYTNYTFESEVKTELSRAGSHFLDDEVVIRDVIGIAKRNDILLTREGIKLERYAGQMHISVHYAVPVDFVILQRNLNFEVKYSSFIGAL